VLGEPRETQYDLHFEMFDIPVRIHPLFWVAGAVIGALSASGSNLGVSVLIWMTAMFVSILIHELGHAVLMKRWGMSPRIVLYMMGGLAIPSGAGNMYSKFGRDFGQQYGKERKSSRFNWQQIAISFAGPGAQVILAGLFVLLTYGVGGRINLEHITSRYIGVEGVENDMLTSMIQAYLFINIFWALLNLLPVYPLDGGQIAREIFQGFDPWDGQRKSLWLSVFAGGGIAVFGLMGGSIFIAILFGQLAFLSYQMLQMQGGGGGRPW